MSDRTEGSFGLTEAAIEQIRGVLAAHPKVGTAVLYGSRAKGTYLPGSDIDLALLGEDLTVHDLLVIDAELDELLLPYKIDLCLYATIESQALVDHVNRVGQTLYERPVHSNDEKLVGPPRDFGRQRRTPGVPDNQGAARSSQPKGAPWRK